MQVDFSAETVHQFYLLNGQSPVKPEPVGKENKDNGVLQREKAVSADAQAMKKPSHLDFANRKVVFDIEPGSNDLIVKVVDPSTGEVVRQIPNEKLHEFSLHINKHV